MASKTITGRRLLYHRGVDDQAGTYVTDYIEAVVCMLLVVTLCIKLISSKGRHHKSTCAVVMVITSISVSALLGGFTHQFLQMVEPYESNKDAYEWLVVWRIASSFSAFLCFGQIMLAQQIMQAEGIYMSKQKMRWFFAIVTISCACLFVYCFLMLIDDSDPWSLRNTFFIVYIFTMLQVSMVVYAITRNQQFCCQSNRHVTKSEIDYKEDVINSDKQINENFIVKEEFFCYNEDILLRKKLRKSHKIHLAASILFLVSGLTQFLLARVFDCADHDHHDESSKCPLPPYFNHNALLHICTTLSLMTTFVAQLRTIKCHQQHQSLLRENTSCDQNNSSSTSYFDEESNL